MDGRLSLFCCFVIRLYRDGSLVTHLSNNYLIATRPEVEPTILVHTFHALIVTLRKEPRNVVFVWTLVTGFVD